MNSYLKIFFRGAGFENKGAEAMLLTTCTELKKRIKNIGFFSAVKNEKEAEKYKANDITPILFHRPNIFSRSLFVGATLLTNPSYFRYLHSYSTLWQIDRIKHYDAVIDISGYAYGDMWGLSGIQKTAKIVKYCKESKKPYVFLPQAWGTFANPGFSDCAKSLCRDASLIYARDEESLNCLRQVHAISNACDFFVPDIAFKFQGRSIDSGKDILKKIGGEDIFSRKVIGIVPNCQVVKQLQGSYENNIYIESLAAAVNHCHKTMNVNVVLLPHHVSVKHKKKNNDLSLCLAIQSKVINKEHCIVLTDDYDAAVLKSIIGTFDLLVASRFHSLVACLSQGIPSVAIGWSHKYPELLGFFGLQEYALNFSEISNELLLKLIDQAMASREKNVQDINAHLSSVIHRIDDMFDVVAEKICLQK